MPADQPRQDLNHTARPNRAGHIDGEALAGPFIDDRQALQGLPIGARVEQEVVGPDVVRTSRRRGPRAGGRHASAGALPGHLQLGLPPEAIQPIGTHAVLPKVGPISPARRTHERQRWFRRGLRRRVGSEGRISVLKRRGDLQRCRYQGPDGVARAVGLGVIAASRGPPVVPSTDAGQDAVHRVPFHQAEDLLPARHHKPRAV